MPFRKIKDAILKDGQPAELTVVIGPESDRQGRLCAFLNASPQPEGPSLHQFLLTHEVPGLNARYFTMRRDGEIAGCIFTTDGLSTGYINSTFVPRPLRQLGIARNPYRALMWIRKEGGYHPLNGTFFTRMQASQAKGGSRWKALVTADGILVGNAVLRPHDCWGNAAGGSYTVDVYVHPGVRSAADLLFEAVMPETGHVQTFLDGASREDIAFFQARGFEFETSLKDDFNHHDPSTRDIRVYAKAL